MFSYDDHVASDDMDVVIQSLADYQANSATASPSPQASTSKAVSGASGAPQPDYIKRQDINAKIAEIDMDIKEQEEMIREKRDYISLRRLDKAKLERELMTISGLTNGKGKGKAAQSGIDYAREKFDWAGGLKERMKSVFGIDNFRLCQQGVCNANMDGRDVVCVMPTGGGKSLTYQLPALLVSGCTLVISPLLALMADQVMHLQEAGVEAVKLTGTTSTAEKSDICRRLNLMAEHRVRDGEKELKLCYVTPEKLAKDNRFLALLQKLDASGRLARIIIDEAHCVSHLGHDFRPDYQKLHRLRQLFPRVPIMALSATCPPAVLQDIVKTLGLREVVDGHNARTQGTVYFSSPLYRKNLHYKVIPKPAKAADVYKAMSDYILENHPNDTGIVYCFTKKDTETVAAKLKECSGNKIRTGVYHAGIADALKENLHKAWRSGTIKVVCATIAFGMGIDKGDVRFVLHHSISKSLEGYYQESGRAGRDGKPADCILYYRPPDSSHISAVISAEKEGETKLHAMLEFAQDLEECRKIQFAKYFSHSSELSIASWATEEEGALQRCGHCDNCTRPPETIERKDVTVATWQLLKIVSAVVRDRSNLTLNMLADLARGAAGGSYEVSEDGKGRKMKVKKALNLEEVAGGPVDMSKNDVEHLIVRLLADKYLQEEYAQTAYNRIVYIVQGQMAPRLIHLTRQAVQSGRLKIEYLFRKPASRSKADGKKKAAENKDSSGTKSTVPRKRKSSGATKGLKAPASEHDGDDDDDDEIEIVQGSDEADMYLDDDDLPAHPFQRTVPVTRKRVIDIDDVNDFDDDSDDMAFEGDWSHSMLRDPPAKRRRSTCTKSKVITEGDTEVFVLSSD